MNIQLICADILILSMYTGILNSSFLYCSRKLPLCFLSAPTTLCILDRHASTFTFSIPAIFSKFAHNFHVFHLFGFSKIEYFYYCTFVYFITKLDTRFQKYRGEVQSYIFAIGHFKIYNKCSNSDPK